MSACWRDAMVLRRNPRAKYVRLKVHPPGRVEVVLPLGVNDAELRLILDQHTSWVEERLLLLRERAVVPVVLPERLLLTAIGQQWEITYSTRQGRSGWRSQLQGHLSVWAETPEQQRRALLRWLSQMGKRYLVPWLEETSRELRLPFSGVTVRGQRSRWGSCSASGRINLNYALLFLQPELVRYLFVHELCHTVHLNHSSRYWGLVRIKEPRYKGLELALRKAAREVPRWLHAPLHDA